MDIIKLEQSGTYSYKDTLLKDASFEIAEGSSSKLVFNQISNEVNVIINLKDNASLRLSILSSQDISNLNITINMCKNSKIEVFFADFSSGKQKNKIIFNQDGLNCYSSFHLASLSSSNDYKVFDISINHNCPNGNGEVFCYGVSKDNSTLIFEGISHIKNASVKTKTIQKANIMVFDKNSRGIARPSLKIDENDIAANHAAAVGKIPDDVLFYMMSRGLNDSSAKELITMGYLRHILKGFSDDFHSEIINAIERKI